MIIDSSALVAILHNEPEGPRFLELILGERALRLSAATYLETAVVIDSRRNPSSSRRLDEFITESRIEIEPLTQKQALLAREAYRDYGKGSGHPAKLNFGDCMAYALARDKGEPVLCKGTDFAATDLTCVP